MPKIGVLIIQLGTPDAPTPAAVRRYLREFLGDPRVVEEPRLKWWFVLNFFILPRRSSESAAKYARIWDARTGSPLLHITRLQAESLAAALPDDFVVRIGMRYGRPTIDQAVTELAGLGVERMIVMPMYPQYSAASTATACDRLFQSLNRMRYMPSIRIVPPFFDHPAYIHAQAELIRAELAKLERPPEQFVFSFHGYPLDFVRKGDPYRDQVEVSAALLARELGLGESDWVLTYQSRFGRQIWLEPYTDETLCKLARQGIRRVLLASPGFTVDCLETIDEIGREVAEEFENAGGEELVRCPCLNDHPIWIDAMKELVLRESQGWYPLDAQASLRGKCVTHQLGGETTILDVQKNLEDNRVSEHLLVRVCRGEVVERTPVWAMRQAGRWDPEFMKLRAGLDFYEFSATPQLAAEASLLPKRFGVDGIILFYDITTLAVAMGMEFTLEPNRGPVPDRPIRSRADAAALMGRPNSDRFGHVIELLRIVKRELAGSLPVLVFASAPFTLASYCIGTGKDVARTLDFIREQPETWELLSAKITEATLVFLDALCRGGADIYQLFDSWAGELPRHDYETWSQRYQKQIFASATAVPAILFVRECPYLDLMAESGAGVISLGIRHELAAARLRYPTLSFQGNVDHDLLVSGTPEQVREATLRCLRQGGGQRHVLNLNHGVDRRTPVENLAEFVRMSHEFPALRQMC